MNPNLEVATFQSLYSELHHEESEGLIEEREGENGYRERKSEGVIENLKP